MAATAKMATRIWNFIFCGVTSWTAVDGRMTDSTLGRIRFKPSRFSANQCDQNAWDKSTNIVENHQGDQMSL
jgi:uncharacterized protein involved in tellurium resistance